MGVPWLSGREAPSGQLDRQRQLERTHDWREHGVTVGIQSTLKASNPIRFNARVSPADPAQTSQPLGAAPLADLPAGRDPAHGQSGAKGLTLGPSAKGRRADIRLNLETAAVAPKGIDRVLR